jgi:pimeloyl-ACP methyl ester carboxylesterase
MARNSSNVHSLSARVARGGLAAVAALSPDAAAEVARALFGLTRRFERPERERALLEQGRSFRFHGPGGVEHHAWRFGAGPKVLLVHGWQGRGAQLGALVQPLVAAEHEVILFDAKAHGDTPGRHVDARDFADAVHTIAEREGRLRAIVAHSMGGMAAAAARKLGTRAERWVVLGSPSSPEGAVDYMQRLLDLSPAVTERFRDKLGARFETPWSEVVDGGIFRDGDAPLLVVHDREDDEVPFVHADRIAKAWGNAEVIETAGLGHRKILWDPAVVERICRFVTGGVRHELETEVGSG